MIFQQFRATLLPLVFAAMSALTAAQSNETIIDRAPRTPLPDSLSASTSGSEIAPPPPGAGTDEGVQRVVETRRRGFTLTPAYEQQFNFTDNVFLAPSTTQEAWVTTSTGTLRYERLPVALGTGQFLISATAVFQRAWHGLGDRDDDALKDLDYYYLALPVTAFYRWGRGWELAGGLSYAQIRSTSGFDRIYADLTPSVSLRRLFSLGQGGYLALGLGTAFHKTDAQVQALAPFREDRNDKWDLSADAAHYYLRGPWTLVTTVRLLRTDYVHWEEAFNNAQDREDLNLGLGIALTRSFAKTVSARVSAAYDQRWSDSLVDYDYKATNLGMAASVSVRY